MNYLQKIDLTKLRGAFTAEIKGKTTSKKCVCIPLDTLFCTEKGAAYLDVVCWENDRSQYGDTHACKQSFSKEVRESLTEEEKKVYIGNMKPKPQTPGFDSKPLGQIAVEGGSEDDLPF